MQYIETKHKEIHKLPNIHHKKDKSKIVKKYLRWINLFVVSKDKCISGIKRENSTGNFYNNQTDIPYTAGPKREGMPSSGMLKLKFLKACKLKSIKSIIFVLFHFRILFKKIIKKR